jgi:ubiquinone/menaquinone biosynthesis C-methylase UbiE
VAANYVGSEFHSGTERLREVVALCLPRPSDLVLDVATGTGNTALALAPEVAWLAGLDLTPEMLALAKAAAGEKGIGNLDWVLGDAHALPFRSGGFDLYTSRAAPHHFLDLGLALSEARRVLKPGGRAAFVDCSAPAAAREVLHEIELRRDPSHVRSYTLDEWRAAIEAAGLVVEAADCRELEWEFQPWMKRMEVPGPEIEALAGLLDAARGPAREQLRPQWRDGHLWHVYWHAVIRARRPW